MFFFDQINLCVFLLVLKSLQHPSPYNVLQNKPPLDGYDLR